jgi:hypothetical protein
MKKRFCFRVRWFAILFVVVSSSVFVSADSGSSRLIDGTIRFELERELITVKLAYNYSPIDQEEASVAFFLNKGLTVTAVRCRVCRSFEYDIAAKPLPTLTVKFVRPLKPGEWSRIEIEYSGSLSDMYNRKERFLELGIDFMWYPVHTRIGEFEFSYQLDIEGVPGGYALASNGTAKQSGKRWRLASRRPDIDINIVLGEGLGTRHFTEKGYNIRIVSRGMSERLVEDLLKDKISTLEFYNSTFGIDDPQKEFTAVYRPFASDLGYFRKGYFVLSQPENADRIYFSVAHELAHHWWNNAGQKDAWLNESFAEYTAMMAVRELKSAERFQLMVEKKRADNVDLPPISGFDRRTNRDQTPLVLYTKGALKLRELEEKIGREDFIKFLRAAAKERVAETDRLISLLGEVISPQEAKGFLESLKN